MNRIIQIAALMTMFVVSSVSAQQTGTVRETHGAWNIVCNETNQCAMEQIFNNDQGEPVISMTIFKLHGETDENGQPIEAAASIIVPLGIFLPAGIGLQIDSGVTRAVPYERCLPVGCIVRAPISNETVQQMKAGSVAKVIILNAPGNGMEGPLSLSGFTAAFNSLQ